MALSHGHGRTSWTRVQARTSTRRGLDCSPHAPLTQPADPGSNHPEPPLPQGRNKRCVAIDLHKSEGQDLVRRLANKSDVLIEVRRIRLWIIVATPDDKPPAAVQARVHDRPQRGAARTGRLVSTVCLTTVMTASSAAGFPMPAELPARRDGEVGPGAKGSEARTCVHADQVRTHRETASWCRAALVVG